jgi:nucleoside-diphosphate-sugar epimerase
VHANLLAAHGRAGLASGRVFNVATNSGITLKRAVAILRDLTGSGPVSNSPERSGDIKQSLVNIRLAEQHLGYKVQVDFREACAERSGDIDDLKLRGKTALWPRRPERLHK